MSSVLYNYANVQVGSLSVATNSTIKIATISVCWPPQNYLKCTKAVCCCIVAIHTCRNFGVTACKHEHNLSCALDSMTSGICKYITHGHDSKV